MELSYVFLIAHVAGIILALHALARPYSPQGTLAWVLALLLIPLPSIPLYLIGAACSLRQRRRSTVARPRSGTRGDGPGRPPILPAVAACTDMGASTGNSVKLLPSGHAAYRSIAHALAHARRSVLIEFYIIRNDHVGDSLSHMLCTCAQRGLQVYVIYDELGCHRLPSGYLVRLRRAGVRVASFNGRRSRFSSLIRLNYRNHRKLVLVDGEIAYIGSANIGQEYLLHNPPWRDAYLRIRGPAAGQALLCFAEDWKRATGQDLTVQAESAPQGRQCCQLIPSGPDNICCNAWQLCLVEIAARARRRLWLATPYLVPGPALCTALQGAALRGVDVRVLVPEKGDSLPTTLAMHTFLPPLARCGVHVLAYTAGFLHEKALVADDALSCLGTGNLDERSMRLNFELAAVVRSHRLAAQVAAMLQRDMATAYELQADTFLKRPFWRRLPAYAARLAAPVL